MNKLKARIGLIASIFCATLAAEAPAQEKVKTINLSIGASHPPSFSWIATAQNVFQPAVNEILEKKSSPYRVKWSENYGGTLYKANATLSSVGEGIVDIGWVFIAMETSSLPLTQISAATPFVTDDVGKILDVVNKLHAKVPELRQEWDNNDVVFLGASGNDTYDLYLKKPVNSMDDIRGLKLTAPAALAVWLLNTGAALKEGGLTTYYTDIQTGLAEGTLSMATGILPAKVYEVAPHITRVNIGAVYSGALVANKDAWEELPADVQNALREAGQVYSTAQAKDIAKRSATALEQMIEVGSKQNPPVTVTEFPAHEREKWAKSLPNIAGDWVKRNGPAAAKVLDGYMTGLRESGVKPVRDWDKEIAAGK